MDYSLKKFYESTGGQAIAGLFGGLPAAIGGSLYNKYNNFKPTTQQLPNDTGSYTGVTPDVKGTSQSIFGNNPTVNPQPDVTKQPSYTPEDVKAHVDAVHNTLNPQGDLSNYIRREYSDLNNPRNDIATGATDPYGVRTNGQQYTPQELIAIQKATAGIYDPAIEDAKTRLSEADRVRKEALTAGPDLGSLLANAPDDATKNMITSIYGSNLGSTAEGKRILSVLQTDPNQAKSLYRQLAYTGLTGTTKQQYNTNQQITSATNSLIQSLDAIGTNNPYKNFWQQNGNFLLQSGDQNYKNLGAQLGAITSAKIHDAYGGALTPGELARADQYIPNLKVDSLSTIKTKIQVLNAYAQLAQDTLIASQYGQPAPSLSDYLPQTSDRPQYPGFKYNPSNNLYEPIAFNSVGGDTKKLATTIANPSGTNRPQRNNNPLNIKASQFTSNFPEVAGVDPNPASDGGQFLAFNSPDAGFNAAKRLITSSGYSGLTVDQALRRWSGGGYGGEIARGIAGKRISDLAAGELDALLQAMSHREGYFA